MTAEQTTRHAGQVLLHPIRLRIVGAAIARDVTVSDLAASLPDVPPATLYRHVNVLIDAGVLDVVAREQVRGGELRTLRTNDRKAVLGSEGIADLTRDDLIAGFTAFTGLLMASFQQYLDTDAEGVATDRVSFRQARLWLTDEELEQMVADLQATLAPYLDKEDATGRRSQTLATILIPDA